MLQRGSTIWLKVISRNHNVTTHQHFKWRSLWTDQLVSPSNIVQSYESTSNNVYINLSIEEYLRHKSPAESHILFLYINKPCVVIGRNQNPWLETNLGLIKEHGRVELVRRKSGGGTVFHDEGNINWTVIMPGQDFNRDKHAEMIARALRAGGIASASVNSRHDVVMARDHTKFGDTRMDSIDSDSQTVSALKVSGSAFKLTRGRALHHGTCLLSSDLENVSKYLRSPARPYIEAKGVESVRSPVGNTLLSASAFKQLVMKEFRDMYTGSSSSKLHQKLGSDSLDIDGIRKVFDELQTPEWKFDQTPQFTFSTRPVQAWNELGLSAPTYFDLHFKHGEIVAASLAVIHGARSTQTQALRFQEAMMGRHLRGGWEWKEALLPIWPAEAQRELHIFAKWLTQVLPTDQGHVRPR